jgi:hypothetical protein
VRLRRLGRSQVWYWVERWSGEVVWRRRRHEVKINDASFAEALESSARSLTYTSF